MVFCLSSFVNISFSFWEKKTIEKQYLNSL